MWAHGSSELIWRHVPVFLHSVPCTCVSCDTLICSPQSRSSSRPVMMWADTPLHLISGPELWWCGVPYLYLELYTFYSVSFNPHKIRCVVTLEKEPHLLSGAKVAPLRTLTLTPCSALLWSETGRSWQVGSVFCHAGYSGQDFDWADYHKQHGTEEAPPFCFRNVRCLLHAARFLMYVTHLELHTLCKLLPVYWPWWA